MKSIQVRAGWKATSLLAVLPACTAVQFTPAANVLYEPRAVAQIIDDEIPELSELATRRSLPHLSERDRCKIDFQTMDLIARKIGSSDYVVVGELIDSGKQPWRSALYALGAEPGGGGMQGMSAESVRARLAAKGAKVGGDVVIVIHSEIKEWETVVVEEGKATTETSGEAVIHGSSVTGEAESVTTYAPTYAYAVQHQAASASAVVLRYSPGESDWRRQVLELPDAQLEEYLGFLRELGGRDEWISETEYFRLRGSFLEELRSRAASSVGKSP